MGGHKVKEALLAKAVTEDSFVLGVMAKLHSLDLQHHDTAPLAKFENWQAHMAYLASLASESENAVAIEAVAAVLALLKAVNPPTLTAAVCHLDWHLGNVLCDCNGELQAVIDWEFAGIGDPRLDLARFCMRKRWTGDGCRCEERGSAEE